MERSLEQRYAIKFCARLGKNATETFQMLQKAFMDDCISRSQSGKWHKAFKEDREEVADEPRSGCPTTARTDENVDRVLEVLRTDRRLSIQKIADTLHMSTFVVNRIVTEDLQMQRTLRCQELLDLIQNEPGFLNSVVTGDESWMFEYDPESKRQNCAWHTKSSPRPKKARMSKSRIKTIIIVFFDIRGIVHCEFVPQGQTVNSAFYLEVLRRLKRRIARVRTDIKDTVKLHHDNATSHTAFIITNFLARSNTPVIPHPPYSPDLAPCDFFLFPRLKREMKGKHWETVENIQHHVTTFLRSIPVEEFQGAFQAWQTRFRKCIDAGGITRLRGVLKASCCLKRSDCCLPPTPVYFLEDSRRFYELLSPVLLLLSLTVLQLASPKDPLYPRNLFFVNQQRNNLVSEVGSLGEAIEAQNQETRETLQAQHQELKESLGLKFKCLEDEISAVKEDVSSVKEEMKDKMSALEERFAAVETGHPRTPVFQQENNNSGRPLVKVPTFDGQSSWTSFKAQFDVVAQANGWNVRDKASFLAAALRGPAVDVLQMIPEQLRLDFNALIDALESRYGEEHYQQLHVVKFKNRLQEKKGSLQDLANDIRRLARLAFPTCPSETQDFIGQQQFINAFGDPETQKFARLSSVTTLQETLVQAMKHEAANKPLGEVIAWLDKLNWIMITCLQLAPENFSGRKLAGSFGNAPDGTIQVSSLRNTENGLLLRGFINGRSCDMVIDTGANVTLVRTDVFQNLYPKPAEVRMKPISLQTATGERAKVHHCVLLSIQIGSKIFQHKGYVADIMDECIIACRVLALEDTQVPPRSECVIKGQLETTKVIPKFVILEGDSEAPSRRILVAKELIDTGRDIIPVRVVNLYDSARAIKKGSGLGNAEPAVLINKNHSVMQKSKREDNVPDHFQQVREETMKELQPGQQKELATLLATYGNIFAKSSKDYGRTDLTKHRINTGESNPIKQAPHRIPLARRQEVETLVKEMLDQNIIEPSSSPWVSPVVLLNDITKKDSYPFPRIDVTLDTLAGSQWFSTLDLKSGYWQVEMHPDDKEKTAFTTGSGLWQFNVMPFGLYNAPATFERLMEAVLQGLATETCMAYMDNIIVLGKNFEEHLSNIEKLFKRLEAANLKLGVQTDPEKTETIRMWPTPKDLTQLRRFLGLCTYYRRFIPGFSNIARPLHRLTESGRSFVWTPDCQRAMDKLKEMLVAAPILAYPRPGDSFILDTDAKLLAIVKSIEHFYHYLYGQEFILRSDHASLQWLSNFKNPEGQLARWIQRLQEYQVEIQHRPGKRHQNADALSRRPCVPQCGHCARAEDKYGMRQVTVQESDEVEEQHRTGQALKKSSTPKTKSLWSLWNSLTLRDGVLYRKWEIEDGKHESWKLVLPRSHVPLALQEMHSSPTGGHFGIRKTLAKARERFSWPETRKGPTTRSKGKLKIYNVGAPFERIAIDVAGPFPKSDLGNKYILIIMDYFTKWPVAVPIPDQEASTVSEALLQDWVCIFGVPRILHSDQGRNFESNIFQELCRRLGIEKTRTTPLHTQSDGMVERFNRTLTQHLTMFVNKNQRD
ncbi:K02A2.6-like [Cordylochernes scorpioides]|uniref:RNA-directed DNA polymerase n=1 Tax=Cordylochernes scorpioides TaxID=51811 RepID=A0ABY6LM42_9ARAC|nr:K02A2.6-like [Cordylochernes scorpioides]